jgi:uncharacterized membrane protein YraQ (UPF0718 family)
MLTNIIREIIYVYNEAAIYIIFGFFVAGLLKVTIPSEKIFKHLGKKNFSTVLKASILGIPLPLCSCAVLPTAVSLKKQGASRGATLSFLISTPETGIDSISITYALIDPIMTIFRPLSAFVTAITAGLFANNLGGGASEKEDREEEKEHGNGTSCTCEVPEGRQKGKLHKLFHYAFVDLLNDIVFWLIIGIIIAGIISVLVPDNFFERYLNSPFLSMVVMLVFGVPIYMCAASSTPIAAALILKGLNPGAALVFLLAGPATNAGTIAAVGKFLGKQMMVIYLGTIVIASVFLGFILNSIYGALNLSPVAVAGQASELLPESLKMAGSFILLVLMIRNLWKINIANAIGSLKDKLFDFTGYRIKSKENKCEDFKEQN